MNLVSIHAWHRRKRLLSEEPLARMPFHESIKLGLSAPYDG
jgi:hypothetical protein